MAVVLKHSDTAEPQEKGGRTGETDLTEQRHTETRYVSGYAVSTCVWSCPVHLRKSVVIDCCDFHSDRCTGRIKSRGWVLVSQAQSILDSRQSTSKVI